MPKLFYALAFDSSNAALRHPNKETLNQALLENQLRTEGATIHLLDNMPDSVLTNTLIYRILVIDTDSLLTSSSLSGIIWKKPKPEQYLLYSVTIGGKTTDFYTHKSSYASFLKEGITPANMARLFRDYHSPRFGLFLTRHWNRSHHGKAGEMERTLLSSGDDIQTALTALLEMRAGLVADPKTNPTGSFMRRLDFAIYKLAEHDALPLLGDDDTAGFRDSVRSTDITLRWK